MERLSPSQIREFIDPRAFMITRSPESESVDRSSATAVRQREVTTSSLESSLNMVLGASRRLDQLSFNLSTMRELAEEGARSGLSERKANEIYGKLRSLTAGFDDVVSQTNFEGKSILDGRSAELSTGAGNLDLELADLRGGGEGSLELIKRSRSADVTVYYETATLLANQRTGLVGLNIEDTAYIEPAEGQTELEDGKYRVEIEYQGPQSTLRLFSEEGALLEEQEDVDLSGNGMEFVEFGKGLRFTISKTQLLESFDKWDWENDGPVSLNADMLYTRTWKHELQDGQEPSNPFSEVSFTVPPRRSFADSALNLRQIETTGVNIGKQELESGSYSLEIDYKGSESTIIIRDAAGNLRERLSKVDLSGTGEHEIDLGIGAKITFENKNWDDTPRKVNAVFDYEKAETVTPQDFDYKAFLETVIEAEEAITAQVKRFAEAEKSLLAIYKGNTGNSASVSAQTLAGSAVSALLGGGSLSRLIASGPTGNRGVVNPFAGGATPGGALFAAGQQIMATIGRAASAQAGNFSARA